MVRANSALALDAAHILTVQGGNAVRLVGYQSGRKSQRTPGSPSLDEQVSIDQTKAGAEMEVNRSEVNAAAEGVRWTEVLRGAGRGPVGAMAMTGMRVVTTELGLVEEPPPRPSAVSLAAPALCFIGRRAGSIAA